MLDFKKILNKFCHRKKDVMRRYASEGQIDKLCMTSKNEVSCSQDNLQINLIDLGHQNESCKTVPCNNQCQFRKNKKFSCEKQDEATQTNLIRVEHRMRKSASLGKNMSTQTSFSKLAKQTCIGAATQTSFRSNTSLTGAVASRHLKNARPRETEKNLIRDKLCKGSDAFTGAAASRHLEITRPRKVEKDLKSDKLCKGSDTLTSAVVSRFIENAPLKVDKNLKKVRLCKGSDTFTSAVASRCIENDLLQKVEKKNPNNNSPGQAKIKSSKKIGSNLKTGDFNLVAVRKNYFENRIVTLNQENKSSQPLHIIHGKSKNVLPRKRPSTLDICQNKMAISLQKNPSNTNCSENALPDSQLEKKASTSNICTIKSPPYQTPFQNIPPAPPLPSIFRSNVKYSYESSNFLTELKDKSTTLNRVVSKQTKPLKRASTLPFLNELKNLLKQKNLRMSPVCSEADSGNVPRRKPSSISKISSQTSSKKEMSQDSLEFPQNLHEKLSSSSKVSRKTSSQKISHYSQLISRQGPSQVSQQSSHQNLLPNVSSHLHALKTTKNKNDRSNENVQRELPTSNDHDKIINKLSDISWYNQDVHITDKFRYKLGKYNKKLESMCDKLEKLKNEKLMSPGLKQSIDKVLSQFNDVWISVYDEISDSYTFHSEYYRFLRCCEAYERTQNPHRVQKITDRQVSEEQLIKGWMILEKKILTLRDGLERELNAALYFNNLIVKHLNLETVL